VDSFQAVANIADEYKGVRPFGCKVVIQLGYVNLTVAVGDIYPSVVIEKQAGVIKAFRQMRYLPGSPGLGGRTKKTALIQRDKQQIKSSVMITQAGCPLAVSIPVAAIKIVTGAEIETGDGVSTVLPVYKIM
jgi:hypothetical protein